MIIVGPEKNLNTKIMSDTYLNIQFFQQTMKFALLQLHIKMRDIRPA